MHSRDASQILKRQWNACFLLMRTLIDRCPDEWWTRAEDDVPVWQQLFHALLALDMYLQETPRIVVNRWVLAITGEEERDWSPDEVLQLFRGVTQGLMNREWIPAAVLSKRDILDCIDVLQERCEALLDGTEDLSAPHVESDQPAFLRSFYWTGATLADKYIYGLRHTQHHIGRVNAYLSRHAGTSGGWAISDGESFVVM